MVKGKGDRASRSVICCAPSRLDEGMLCAPFAQVNAFCACETLCSCLTGTVRLAHISVMHLRDYLRPADGHRITATDLANRMGVSHTTVIRWADGTISPSAAALVALHKATDGKVTPNDMLNVDVAA